MLVKYYNREYAVVELPRSNVENANDALKLMSSIKAEGLKPMHRMEGAYGACFMCEIDTWTPDGGWPDQSE